MGADLIINCVAINTNQSLDETRNNMLKEVDDIKEISEEIKTYYCEGLYEYDIPQDLEKIKSDLKEGINQFFDCLNARDVSWIVHKGDKIYITGGLSWGDSPTESSNKFNRFWFLPQKVLDAGNIKWYE